MNRIRQIAAAVGIVLLSLISLAGGIADAAINASSPAPWQPFLLSVTFSQPLCTADDHPLLAEAELKAYKLSLTLTHIRNGACSNTKQIRVPALRPGRYAVTVAVTRRESGYGGGYALIGEQIDGSIVVPEPVGAAKPAICGVAFVTYGDIGDSIIPAPYGAGAVYTRPITALPVTLGGPPWGAILEQAGQATFIAECVPDGVSPPPLTRVYDVRYPAGFGGNFLTTDREEALRLMRAWWPANIDAYGGEPDGWRPSWVGRLESGACPLGMKPVYRLFHPVAIAHRYTTSMSAYRVLIENGYTGEGARFCARTSDDP